MKSDPVERFLALRKEAESSQRDLDRARGGLDALLARLREEFGQGSLEMARKRLAKLIREEARLEAELAKGIEELERKWEGRP